MTAHAVRGIERRRMRLMARQTLSLNPPVVGTEMECAPRNIVAFGARRARVRGSGVCMHVMAGPARSLMWISGQVESRRPPLHLMAAQALRVRRHQRPHRRDRKSVV